MTLQNCGGLLSGPHQWIRTTPTSTVATCANCSRFRLPSGEAIRGLPVKG